MNFLIIKCSKCGKKRKVVVGSLRHKLLICGECWNWTKANPENNQD